MAVLDPLEVALHERHYISARTPSIVGVRIYGADGALRDADGPVMGVIVNEADEEVYAANAHHTDTGTYDLPLLPANTAIQGLYQIFWSYEVDGETHEQVGYIEVGPPSPDYDVLSGELRDVVGQVYYRFADLFDSPLGGPHLQVYLQTNFGRNRMAQLMGTALRRLNVIAQPHQTYSLTGEGGSEFPVAKWGGVLELATYIEVLKHLVRSYTEQPTPVGVNVAYFDRRDYANRWQQILDAEQRDLKEMLDHFKMSHMGLGGVSTLVSGGVYGNWGPTRTLGLVAARPYYWRAY